MDSTVITLKRKSILSVIEYCLDNKLEFTVKDKEFGHDEFELKLTINDIKKALAFGYYARENKIDIPGITEPVKPAPAKSRTSKTNSSETEDKGKTKEKEAVKEPVAEINEQPQQEEEKEERSEAMLF